MQRSKSNPVPCKYRTNTNLHFQMNSVGITLEHILNHAQINRKENIPSIIVVPANVLRLKKSEVLELEIDQFSGEGDNDNHCKSEYFHKCSSSIQNLRRSLTFWDEFYC